MSSISVNPAMLLSVARRDGVGCGMKWLLLYWTRIAASLVTT
jgi:hypothetical protein